MNGSRQLRLSDLLQIQLATMQTTTQHTQKLMRLLWVGLAGLTCHLSVTAQANAYWEQRQCTWSATLIHANAETYMLDPWDLESMVMKQRCVIRTWQLDGGKVTASWLPTHDQRPEWMTAPPTYVNQGNGIQWQGVDSTEIIQTSSGEGLALFTPHILPTAAEQAILNDQGMLLQPDGAGRLVGQMGQWTITWSSSPAMVQWQSGDSSHVTTYQSHPMGWYVAAVERRWPRRNQQGLCMVDYMLSQFSKPAGMSWSNHQTWDELLVTPSPHEQGPVTLSLRSGDSLHPEALTVIDVQGRVVIKRTKLPSLPFTLPYLSLTPGHYRMQVVLGPLILTCPFLQL
jgi:hypothetical protein|tara:strand:- start:2792 stop:3817 length:1026 start_codon:yes stop_codon:yes gene_type:complete